MNWRLSNSPRSRSQPSRGLTTAMLIAFALTSILLLYLSSPGPSPKPAFDLHPVVETSNGPVRGIAVTLSVVDIGRSGSYVDWFFGIPYAKPPTGQLRFEKPQPLDEKWDADHTLDVTSPLSALPCYWQRPPPPGLAYTEDCLKLNIYRPSSSTKESALPVLVFIHGGGWVAGGLLVEGPFGFTANFVSKGIIVVHLAYRLAALGFLSDGTRELPGNMALWDQRMALQWISGNIASFGGDPSRVMLWGQSAGAASVGFHSVMEESRALFQQAIQMSGSWNSPWALDIGSNGSGEKTVTTSLSLAERLGCVEARWRKECLKRVSIESILNATASRVGIFEKFKINQHHPTPSSLIQPYASPDFAFTDYQPRIDGDFFGEDFESLVRSAPRKPSMFGFTTDESILMNSGFDVTTEWTLPPSRWASFDDADLIEFINQKVVPVSPNSSTAHHELVGHVRRALIEEYVNRPDGPSNTTTGVNFVQRYTQLLSDIQFIVPLFWEVRLKAQNGWPTHLFRFNHVNPSLAGRLPYPAVVHAGEYPYVMGLNLFGQFVFNPNDERVSEWMVEAYANFVKTGNPSTYNVAWSQLSNPGCIPANEFSAMLIEVEPRSEFGFGSPIFQRLVFWDRLVTEVDIGKVKGFTGTPALCRLPLPFHSLPLIEND